MAKSSVIWFDKIEVGDAPSAASRRPTGGSPIFIPMRFVLEPLFLHRRIAESKTPEADFALMERVHRIPSQLDRITVMGAAAGNHGLT